MENHSDEVSRANQHQALISLDRVEVIVEFHGLLELSF